MTVQEQNLVQYYEGPISIGTSLPINEFTFIDNSHVAVKVRGENTNWIYGTDYTVSGATTFIRTLTLLKAVPSEKVLAAFVEIPITQGLAPEEGGNFPAATQELTLDKLTYICQMLYSRIKRSVQVSIDNNNFDGLLYDVASQAGRAIIINELGTGLTYSTDKINDIMTFVKSLFSQMEDLNTEASTSATNAAASATIATTQAGIAITQAGNASAYATAAQTAVNRIDGTVVTNLDTIAANGFYSCAATATGVPSASYPWIVLHETDGTNRYQYAIAANSTVIAYERIYVSGAWGPWTLRTYRGISEYDAGTTYYIGSVVKKTGTFELYGSLTDDNVGNALTVDTEWQFLCDLKSTNIIPIGTCSTASATAEKVVNISGVTLTTGLTIQVVFTNANTAAVPTLNFNGTVDAIYCEKGIAVSATNIAYFPAGATIEFTFDGTNWIFKNRIIEEYVNSSTNYQRHSNGMIYQTGLVNTNNAGATVTFPIAFPTAIINNGATNRAGVADNSVVSTNIGSKTQMTVWTNQAGFISTIWNAKGY